MTFAFGDVTVTTWGEVDGQQQWRARNGEKVGHFLADRDAPVEELHRLGRAAVGLPMDPSLN